MHDGPLNVQPIGIAEKFVDELHFVRRRDKRIFTKVITCVCSRPPKRRARCAALFTHKISVRKKIESIAALLVGQGNYEVQVHPYGTFVSIQLHKCGEHNLVTS
jgi:hypothetical protein